eukprot:m51a1_g573 hypothetical protein (330) ;mRNA; f:538145-539339
MYRRALTFLATLMCVANTLVFLATSAGRGAASRGAGSAAEAADEGPVDARTDVVVISPHLDDAILGAFSVLGTRGRAAEVVSVFAGRPNRSVLTIWDRKCGFSNSNVATETRAREDIAALALAGSAWVHWPFTDAQYRFRPTDANYVPVGVVQARVLESLRRHILDRATPRWPGEAGRTLAVMAPVSSAHPDHQVVRWAFANLSCELLELFERAAKGGGGTAYRPVEFWLYEDLWYSATMGHVPSAVEKADGLTYDTHLEPYNESTWELKWSALAQYKSQYKHFYVDKITAWQKKRCSAFGLTLLSSRVVACEAFYRLASCKKRQILLP